VDRWTPEENPSSKQERVLTCLACGAVWRSLAGQQLVEAEGCLSCGSRQLVEERPRPPPEPKEI